MALAAFLFIYKLFIYFQIMYWANFYISIQKLPYYIKIKLLYIICPLVFRANQCTAFYINFLPLVNFRGVDSQTQKVKIWGFKGNEVVGISICRVSNQ